MNSNTRGVLSSLSKHSKLAVAGVIALAVTLMASTGIIALPGTASAAADPMMSNLPAMPSNEIAPLVSLSEATEAVARRMMPAVVSITVTGKTKPQGVTEMGPNQIPAPFQQFFGFGTPFRMRPQSQVFEAEGTGIIVSPDGYIVTNNHVVHDATRVNVTLHDGRTFNNAKVVGRDKASDLAVIKIDATGLKSAAFGDSRLVQPGEAVLAIGDPLGMNFSVTRGIVSATNRNRALSDGPNSRGSFIQTDAAINHGNSGGPLVDDHGNVIGINTEMLSTSGASEGIGFAIPSDLVKTVATQLIEHGKVTRGYLGIDVTGPSSPGFTAAVGALNESGSRGALVDQVNAGSPAEAAGLKPYDLVTGFNGHKVEGATDLQNLSGDAAPGSVAKVNVLRNGKPMTFSVTMGNYDNATANGAGSEPASSGGHHTPKLGLTVEPLTPSLRGQLQLPDSVNGLVVDSVSPGGPAMLAGVARGDVIEQVNQHPVTSVHGLEKQVEATAPGKSVLLMVHSSNGNFIMPVQPQR
jgi:serine protease Do